MPRVSIHCITYQQEDYVGQAIDGVLAQDYDDWELVIADDGSADRTLEIAREYEDRHPRRIRVLSQDNENDTGKRNYLRALAECRGEFIAGLDGDDLWTSPAKLRRQVELMESRPEVSACFHDMTLLRDGTTRGSIGPASLREYRDHDLIRGVHLSRSSALFRSGLVETFPDGYLDPRLQNGDVLHFLLWSRRGPLVYLPEILGTYRLHGASFWSSHRKAQQIEINMSSRQVFREIFPGDYDSQIRRYLIFHAVILSALHLLQGRPLHSLQALGWAGREIRP